MNLGQQAAAAVRARARTARAPFVHQEVIGGIHLKIEVQDLDKYGVLLHEIVVSNEQPADQRVRELLQRQAAEIESRFTYLLEAFRLIELDETAGTAQIRSGTPYHEAGALHYYEVLLRGGNTLTFTRYQRKDRNSARALEACYVTEQLLARICEDAAAVLRVRV